MKLPAKNLKIAQIQVVAKHLEDINPGRRKNDSPGRDQIMDWDFPENQLSGVAVRNFFIFLVEKGNVDLKLPFPLIGKP
jgi:hypothetical protein